MAQKKEQWFMIIAASLFVVGAVFMLVNALGGYEWALWFGIGFAAASAILYIIVQAARVRFKNKYTPTESEIIAAEQKAAAAPEHEVVSPVESNDTLALKKPAAPKKTGSKPKTKSKKGKK